MSTLFAIFVYASIIILSFIVGWLIGFENQGELYRQLYRTWKSNNEAYLKGVSQGFDNGWECAYGHMIDILQSSENESR